MCILKLYFEQIIHLSVSVSSHTHTHTHKIRVETRAESSWWLLCVLVKVLLVPNPKFIQAGLCNKKEVF